MAKSLKNQFLSFGLIEKTENGRLSSAFNLSYIFKYGKSLGLINTCAYSHFYNKFHELDGCKMSEQEKKQFFSVLTKIMISIEKIKINEGIV